MTPIWRLGYPQETPNLRNIRPDFTTLDWAFIVGYVLSFVAILFTFRFDFRRTGTRHIAIDLGKRYPAAPCLGREVFRGVHQR